ncbi:hypothetical protein EW146_g9749 [Bondarzewia mesenterica]|uniref:Uncharacterized protein n=1 Tax=Bondarzewia mesenterica TaxID=1095465 RepID=A0A4S4L3U4_9AGAM|nr:hypothetical protein EW146_g9749 [Bondarzewia mesenterica]
MFPSRRYTSEKSSDSLALPSRGSTTGSLKDIVDENSPAQAKSQTEIGKIAAERPAKRRSSALRFPFSAISNASESQIDIPHSESRPHSVQEAKEPPSPAARCQMAFEFTGKEAATQNNSGIEGDRRTQLRRDFRNRGIGWKHRHTAVYSAADDGLMHRPNVIYPPLAEFLKFQPPMEDMLWDSEWDKMEVDSEDESMEQLVELYQEALVEEDRKAALREDEAEGDFSSASLNHYPSSAFMEPSSVDHATLVDQQEEDFEDLLRVINGRSKLKNDNLRPSSLQAPLPFKVPDADEKRCRAGRPGREAESIEDKPVEKKTCRGLMTRTENDRTRKIAWFA